MAQITITNQSHTLRLQEAEAARQAEITTLEQIIIQ